MEVDVREVSVANQFLYLFDEMTSIRWIQCIFKGKYIYYQSISRIESILPKLAHCHRLSLVTKQLKYLLKYYFKKLFNFPMLILTLIILDKSNPLQLIYTYLDVWEWASFQKFDTISNRNLTIYFFVDIQPSTSNW